MICPWCEIDLHCLDSQTLHFGDTIGGGRKKRRAKITNARERRWGCSECSRRYWSIEVLNPTPYMIKKVPKLRLEKAN